MNTKTSPQAPLRVDLNADLAEGCANDAALLQIVTSVNVCCGLHAGNAALMASTMAMAKQQGVRVGAHPSFPDRENFGRTVMPFSADFTPEDLKAYLLYQLGAAKALAAAHQLTLSYVKPHGALYNQANKDPALAQLIARTVRAFDPQLHLMALSGSLLLKTAQAEGLSVISEVFGDRRYMPDGSLVPRSHPQALIERDEDALAQVLQMVCEGRVKALDGQWIPVQADSICLHGDGAHALSFAQTIKDTLIQKGVTISSTLC